MHNAWCMNSGPYAGCSRCASYHRRIINVAIMGAWVELLFAQRQDASFYVTVKWWIQSLSFCRHKLVKETYNRDSAAIVFCFCFFVGFFYKESKGEKSICIVKSFLSSHGAEPQALPAIVCECVTVRDHPLHTLTVYTTGCQLEGWAVNCKLSFQLKYDWYPFTSLHCKTDCVDGWKCFPGSRASSPSLIQLESLQSGLTTRRTSPGETGPSLGAISTQKSSEWASQRGGPHNSFQPIIQTGSAIQLGWLRVAPLSLRSPGWARWPSQSLNIYLTLDGAAGAVICWRWKGWGEPLHCRGGGAKRSSRCYRRRNDNLTKAVFSPALISEGRGCQGQSSLNPLRKCQYPLKSGRISDAGECVNHWYVPDVTVDKAWRINYSKGPSGLAARKAFPTSGRHRWTSSDTTGESWDRSDCRGSQWSERTQNQNTYML